MRIWAISDGRSGMRIQALGLAQATATRWAKGNVAVVEKRVDSGKLQRFFPHVDRLLTPGEVPPDMVIACGGAALFPTLALQRRYGAFTVYAQRPFWGEAKFDAIIRQHHDGPGGENTLTILGAVGGITAADIAVRRRAALSRFGISARPCLGVLLGGANRAFAPTRGDFRELAHTLSAAITAAGGSLLAVSSRRTGKENEQAFADVIAKKDKMLFLPAAEDNAIFRDILAAADVIAATGDSVNMLSEVCSVRKPLLILSLPIRAGIRRRAAHKFVRFHEALTARNLARPFRGKIELWESPGLDETTRAAEWIISRYHR